MTRQVNASALAIASETEGFVLVGYRDPAGIATAGYGHTGPEIIIGKTYTMEQALAWREADMASAAGFVETHVHVPLTDNQFSALAEFTYNVGIGSFGRSTLLRLLNAGNYDAVPAQLMRWTKAGGKILPGLVARRTREAALFALDKGTPVFKAQPITPPSLFERLCAWFARKVGS